MVDILHWILKEVTHWIPNFVMAISLSKPLFISFQEGDNIENEYQILCFPENFWHLIHTIMLWNRQSVFIQKLCKVRNVMDIQWNITQNYMMPTIVWETIQWSYDDKKYFWNSPQKFVISFSQPTKLLRWTHDWQVSYTVFKEASCTYAISQHHVGPLLTALGLFSACTWRWSLKTIANNLYLICKSYHRDLRLESESEKTCICTLCVHTALRIDTCFLIEYKLEHLFDNTPVAQSWGNLLKLKHSTKCSNLQIPKDSKHSRRLKKDNEPRFERYILVQKNLRIILQITTRPMKMNDP